MKTMIQNLLSNWKTTGAGLALIGHGIIHLAFCLKAGTADEATWNLSIGEVIAGSGLMLAGDASSSTKAHAETLTELENIKSAVRTGDTSILTKPGAGQAPTPPVN